MNARLNTWIDDIYQAYAEKCYQSFLKEEDPASFALTWAKVNKDTWIENCILEAVEAIEEGNISWEEIKKIAFSENK